jgi:hypothetical protein
LAELKKSWLSEFSTTGMNRRLVRHNNEKYQPGKGLLFAYETPNHISNSSQRASDGAHIV